LNEVPENYFSKYFFSEIYQNNILYIFKIIFNINTSKQFKKYKKKTKKIKFLRNTVSTVLPDVH